jgi:hypothetical protein
MNSRGAAVVESAFVMSVVLMVLFGALQLSLLAFTQTSQDGAAFVAARAYAENPSGGAVSAEAAAHAIFTHVPVLAFTVTPSGGTVTVAIAGTGKGLPVPGTPSAFALGSVESEIVGGTTGSDFGVTDTLQNYYTSPGDANAVAGLLKPRSILAAQTFATGHGINGRFAEWYCRQSAYSGVSIPTTTLNGAANCQSGSHNACFFDPMRSGGALSAIYGWDAGTTCN